MLYVLDGSGFLFRAYYSMPHILDKTWNDAWAIFWFYRMILKLLQDKPDHFIIVFDPWKKTKRMEEFKEYKANRPKIDDSFKQQIPKIIDIARQSWINVELIPEYEADDVIWSIVNIYDKESFVISSDKDLKQLISDKIKFIEPKTMEITDETKFKEEYWFNPKWIILYLALLWDSADNIPWVKWIGKKTAQDIVSKFQTYDDLIENIDQLKPKIQEKILENKDLLKKNIELVTLLNPWDYKSAEIEKKSDISNINFRKLENILVWEYWLSSFAKLISKLEKDLVQPTQQSLF